MEGRRHMNPRGVQVELPAFATARLTELSLARDLALEASRACQQKINQLPDDSPSQMLARLVTERDKQAQRNNSLHRLLSSVNQYLFQLRLPPGCYLKPVSTPVTLAKGETAAQAIGALRVEMLAIAQELAKVRHAPLPITDQIAAAERYVTLRGGTNAPRVAMVRDQLQLTFADDVAATKTDLIGLLCWLAPTSVIAALKREIEQSPAGAGALPAADRDRRVRELEAQLLGLERRESALLDKADSVLPRHDMNPLAFLGIEIAAREAQQQVA
jgi:hypothetical protein